MNTSLHKKSSQLRGKNSLCFTLGEVFVSFHFACVGTPYEIKLAKIYEHLTKIILTILYNFFSVKCKHSINYRRRINNSFKV